VPIQSRACLSLSALARSLSRSPPFSAQQQRRPPPHPPPPPPLLLTNQPN
jgi:hypothetical protein